MPRTLSVAALALLLAVISLYSLASSSSRAYGESTDTKYEYFFVVDTSKSMVGYQGSANIFPEVKKTISEYIGVLDQGNTVVYISPFAQGLTTSEPHAFEIATQADKAAAQDKINGLEANGSYTWIYQSLSDVIDQANEVRAADPNVNHVQTIFLFTDGINNGPVSLADTLSKLKLARGENPYLFLKYITLGTTADSGWDNVAGVDVQNTPSGTAPQLLSVRVKPPLLDFGSLKDSETSEMVVRVAFDPRLEGKQIALSIDGKQVEAEGALVSIAPTNITLKGSETSEGFSEMTQQLTLTVDNRGALADTDVFGGKIRFTSPGAFVAFSPPEIDYSFNLAPRSTIEVNAPDRDSLAVALGALDPYDEAATLEKLIPVELVFNDRALSTGAYVRVHLVQTSGPRTGLAQLVGSDGEATDILQVGSDSPEFAVAISVPQGTEPGELAFQVVMDPHAAELSGVGLEPTPEGASQFSVSFSVPEAPEPTWRVVVRWLLWALLGMILLALVAFIVLVVKSGSGPGRILGLLVRKLHPTMLDGRIEVVKPYEASAMIELTGKKSLDIGLGTPYLGDMPFTLRFEPEISVTEAKDSLLARVVQDGTGTFSVLKITSGFEEPGVRTAVVAGDLIRVETSGGTVYELAVQSFKYTPV